MATRITVGRLALAAGFALATTAGVALAEPPAGKGKGKPQQVHPTGKEDAPKAPTVDDLAGEALIEQITSRSTEGLQVVELPDGTKMVDLEGRFMHVMRAVPDGKGGVRLVCNTHGQVETPLVPVSKATPALEEK
jgi:hypothetical protein